VGVYEEVLQKRKLKVELETVHQHLLVKVVCLQKELFTVLLKRGEILALVETLENLFGKEEGIDRT
jgi:hypothetical protein